MGFLLKNISYTFTANLICAIISVLVTFILPKGISVENYGYFQLYLFYICYTGFLSFGWTDGLFLRYAGSFYDKLDKSLWGSQFKLFCTIEFIFSILWCLITTIFIGNDEKRSLVFLFIGISIIFSLPTSFLKFLLQGTNRIIEYAIATILERLVFGICILLIFLSNQNSFLLPIVGFTLGLIIALCYTIFQCKDLLFTRYSLNKTVLKEIFTNINVGSKLMIANVMGWLIIGVVRWSIERAWDVVVFGKISLTLYVSNVMMIFIRSVSMVMLPALRRIDNQKYASIYTDIKVILFALIFGGLLVYYPLNLFLTYWLPDYVDCLKYMALLFPICVFEGKLSILVEMYLKTMRLEKKILSSNITTLIFSVIMTFVSVFILENLSLAVLGMLVIFAFRTTLGEYILSKHLDIDFYRNIALEFFLVTAFVCSSWFIDGLKGCAVYGCTYAAFLLLFRKKIVRVLKERVMRKK